MRLVYLCLSILVVCHIAIAQNLDIALTPANPPVYIPSTGGSIEFNIAATNYDAVPCTCDFWTLAQLPDTTLFGPILGPVEITLNGTTTIERDRIQRVPEYAPDGEYYYYAYLGIFPTIAWAADSFQIQKFAYGEPDTVWSAVTGGEGQEEGWCGVQTSDGGCIVTGFTQSFGAGSRDMYLIKYGPYGNEEWSQTYGGSNNERGYGVLQTSDGGYLIAGCTSTWTAGAYDVYLVKTDSLGNEEWNQHWGDAGANEIYDIRATDDGGYILCGIYGNDAYLVKIDASGNPLWAESYGETDATETAWCVQVTPDGGYVFAGQRIISLTQSAYVVKTDEAGLEEWSATFGPNDINGAHGIDLTDDGGYIVAGWSFTSDLHDVYLIKLDESGNADWQYLYGTATWDAAYDVETTYGGGYIAVGYSGDLDDNIYVLKTDDQGDIEWEKFYGGPNFEKANYVHQATDGGYFIVGHTGSFGAGSYDIYLLRMSPSDGEVISSWDVDDIEPVAIPEKHVLLNNYPNPFNPSTVISYGLPVDSRITLSVYDITGREVACVAEGWRTAGNHQVTFDGSYLPSGIYFYRLTAGKYNAVGKMVLMK